tara:strand:- start:295 stop:1455 length:1161 start_codon:yes stop_codon:yes gene_type:complete
MSINIQLDSSTLNFPQSKKNIESLIGKSVKVNNTKNRGLVKFSITNNAITHAVNVLKTVIEHNKIIELGDNKKLIIGKHLASGTYGKVYNGTLYKDDIPHKVVIKQQEIRKSLEDKSIILEILINILLKTDKILFRFVPKYYGSYKIDNSISIISEFVSSSTYDDLIQQVRKQSVQQANNVISSIYLQVLLTLNVMQHRYNFVHGDLKTNNLMVLPTNQKKFTINGRQFNPHGYTFKYIDFGFSCMTSYTQSKIHVPHYYSDDICGKKHIDTMFLSIHLLFDLERFKLTDLPIYTFLKNKLDTFLKLAKIKRAKYISVSNKIVNGNTYNNSKMFKNDYNKAKGHIGYELLRSTLPLSNKTAGFDVFHPDKLYVDFVKDMGFNVVKV